MNDAFATVL
ncbi:hypothetical protein HaLaN_21211, partial [Haematococcus lacustris]